MGMDPFLGEISMFAGNFAPRGWAFCDGQILPIANFDALFSLLGTYYGGDGRTSFGLPDLRGRVPMHAGTGPGLTPRRIGQRGGQEAVILTVNQIPSHHHFPLATTEEGNVQTPENAVLSDEGKKVMLYNTQPNAYMKETSDTGGGQPHSNMQPFLAFNYIIALQGTYPSRT